MTLASIAAWLGDLEGYCTRTLFQTKEVLHWRVVDQESNPGYGRIFNLPSLPELTWLFGQTRWRGPFLVGLIWNRDSTLASSIRLFFRLLHIKIVALPLITILLIKDRDYDFHVVVLQPRGISKLCLLRSCLRTCIEGWVDLPIWKLSSDRLFSVRSFYTLLNDGGQRCPFSIYNSKLSPSQN